MCVALRHRAYCQCGITTWLKHAMRGCALPLEGSMNLRACQICGRLMIASCCAAVLPFAKRGDDRSNNLKRLQQLFPRIVAGQYQAPRRASDACKHLLQRLLTPDPVQRITVPEIMIHPW